MSLEQKIGYTFQNPKLLTHALTHPSRMRYSKNFERLEFLGDRVLGLVVSLWIFESFPYESEGDMTKRFSALVSRESCLKIAQVINLTSYLKAYVKNNVMDTHILSDGIEALIGGIYLDGGLVPCTTFIKSFWADLFTTNKNPPKDPKSSLQEWAQSHNKKLPIYELLKVDGLDHSPVFIVRVSIEGFASEEASANVKRVAEQKAALKLFEKVCEKKIKKALQ